MNVMEAQTKGDLPDRQDFRALAENSPDLIARFDRNLRHLYANPAVERATGIPSQQFVGKTSRELNMPDDRVALWERTIRDVFETGREATISYSYPTPEGERYFESRVVPETESDGSIPTVIGITRDITARRRAEDASQQSEAVLRGFFNAAWVGMAVIELNDDDFTYVMVNGWCASFFNRSLEEVNGKTARRLGLPERTRLQWLALFRECSQTQKPFSIEYSVPRDGQDGYYYATVSPIPTGSDGRQRFSVAILDIAERKRTEEALRSSEERYRRLFDSIDEGFCVVEMLFDEQDLPIDYRFIEANPAFERHTGLIGALGRTAREMVPDLDESWFRIYGNVALTGQADRFENHAPAMGRWFDVYAFPIGDLGNRHVALLFNDITRRKQIEEALLEADRRKDEFLATLAHELRNPLAAISSAVSLGSELDLPDPEVQEVCHIINNQTYHMKRLLDDLLDVARITQGRLTLQKEPLEVEQIVAQAIEMVRPLIDERQHHLSVTSAPAPLRVHGDLTRLAQVLANLLNNAARYTPEGGRISLATESTREHVVFRVRDNGMGIAPEAMTSLFDPFNRTNSHANGQGGLGLGLALVRNLVFLHDGTVEARSEGPGNGSEFIVRLPRVAETGFAPAAESSPPKSSGAQRGLLRVLLVEDNADLAKLTARLLEKQGFDVRTAADGPSALEVTRTYRPDTVVMDLGLPGMSGLEVAQHMRRAPETQDARIIALSGYGQPQDIQRSKEAGCDEHLVKPVDPRKLAEVISTARQD